MLTFSLYLFLAHSLSRSFILSFSRTRALVHTLHVQATHATCVSHATLTQAIQAPWVSGRSGRASHRHVTRLLDHWRGRLHSGHSCHLGRRQEHDAGRASDAARVAQATQVTHPVLLWPFRPFSSRNWCYSGHWWAMMLLGPLGPLVGPLGPLMPPMLPFGPFRPPAGA